MKHIVKPVIILLLFKASIFVSFGQTVEFRIAAKTSDRIRFWKTGYIFQTFESVEARERRNMNIRLEKSGTLGMGYTKGETAPFLLGIILDGVRLSKEEWNDVNFREIKSRKGEFSDEGKSITLIFTTK